jgi:hypothetical protein
MLNLRLVRISVALKIILFKLELAMASNILGVCEVAEPVLSWRSQAEAPAEAQRLHHVIC